MSANSTTKIAMIVCATLVLCSAMIGGAIVYVGTPKGDEAYDRRQKIAELNDAIRHETAELQRCQKQLAEQAKSQSSLNDSFRDSFLEKNPSPTDADMKKFAQDIAELQSAILAPYQEQVREQAAKLAKLREELTTLATAH